MTWASIPPNRKRKRRAEVFCFCEANQPGCVGGAWKRTKLCLRGTDRQPVCWRNVGKAVIRVHVGAFGMRRRCWDTKWEVSFSSSLAMADHGLHGPNPIPRNPLLFFLPFLPFTSISTGLLLPPNASFNRPLTRILPFSFLSPLLSSENKTRRR